MGGLLTGVVTYALLPAAAAVTGAAVSALRPPGPKLRGVIQHFAAGVVFSVVAVELLPDIVRKHRPVQVVAGFAVGVVAMLVIRALTGNVEEAHGAAEPNFPRLPVAMLACVAVDVLVDGFLVGVGFAAGQKEGRLLTLALTVELLSLGLALTVTLRGSGVARGRAVALVALLSLLIVAGAAAGATLLAGLSEAATEVVLSFGLAALLFLVTEELLVEAHEEPETPLVTATFFAGFLLFLILGMVG